MQNEWVGQNVTALTLLNAAIATGPGPAVTGPSKKTFQATISNTTTPSATVLVQVSNDNVGWLTIGTISLSTAGQTDGFSTDAPWLFSRGDVSAISGVSASVTLTMGV